MRFLARLVAAILLWFCLAFPFWLSGWLVRNGDTGASIALPVAWVLAITVVATWIVEDKTNARS